MIQKNRLPDEYQEVEYLESTGTQWIDIDVFVNNNLYVELDIAYKSTNNVSPFGFLDVSPLYRFNVYINTSYFYVGIGKAENQKAYPPSVISINNKCNIKAFSGGAYVNDELYPVNGDADLNINSDHKFRIFGRSGGSSYTKKFIGRIFFFKVLNQYNLIPCYRKSDNKPGMYDLASGEFFTNQGTDEFIVGPDIINKTAAKHIYKGSYVLPKEYEEVEYLEAPSNDTVATSHYIVTDYTANVNTELDLVFSFNNIPQRYRGIVGSENNANTYDFRISLVNNSKNIMRIEYSASLNEKHHVGSKNGFYYLDDNISNNKIKDCIYPLTMFGLRRGDSHTDNFGDNSELRIYSCIIKENGILLRNYVPCYRKSDNLTGIYDTVNGNFLSCYGSRNFITGPEVKKKVKFIIKDNRVIFADESLLPSEYRRVKYLESHGTEIINTDVNLNTNFGSQLILDIQSKNTNAGRFGCYANSLRFYTGFYNGKIIIGNGKEGTYNHNVKVADTERHVYILNKNGLYEDGILLSAKSDYGYGTQGYPIIINHNSLPNGKGEWKIFKFILWKENKIERYYIPSVRNSDNKPGMYDLVTNTFFTNAGTGEFEWEELEPQEDFIIDGTPLHTYKLQSLLREISEDSENYVVIGNISDIHGQCADDLEANNGSIYHCNLDQVDSSVRQLQSFMHKASTLGASTPATVFTGDLVGRIKPGTGSNDPSVNNETGAYLSSNIEKLKELYETYGDEQSSNTALLYGFGNHDARGFEADSHTLEDAKGMLTALNPQFTYPNETNCTGYWYDEKDNIVFVYLDNYKYTNGDSEGSTETIKTLLTQLNTQYPDAKFLLFGHQPVMKPSESTKCVNSEFYAGLTSDSISMSPLSSGFNVTNYIPAEKILAGIYGHQHANALNIEYGYPIIQQPCLGELRTNDGGQSRHNYYNGTVQLGFVTEKTEFANNAPASYTYFIWTYNKKTGIVKCTTLGVGPDTEFVRQNDHLELHGFAHVFAPERNDLPEGTKCQFISDPRWTANTNPVDALAYGSVPFIYSSYAYQCECSLKDGVMQTPFGLKNQYYCFAYYVSEGGTKTLKAVSEMYAPITDDVPFIDNQVVVSIEADAQDTVILNGNAVRNIVVPRGEVVTYSVSRNGYIGRIGTITTSTCNITKKIVLEEERNPKSITLIATNGAIICTPSSPASIYNEGTLIDVNFIPDSGYKFKSATLTMGGTTQAYTDSFSFSITSDATINASFEEDSAAWIAGNVCEMSEIPVKYVFIQAVDSKYDAFNWDTATLETPNPIKDANWAMFMWVENPNAYGLTSVTLHGNSDVDYSYRSNFSCYTGKNYSYKLENYSDLEGRGSSMGQTDDIDLVVNSTDMAIGWAYKLSNDSTGEYFTATGRFFTKLTASLNFNK